MSVRGKATRVEERRTADRWVLLAPSLLMVGLMIGMFNASPIMWPTLVRPLLVAMLATMALTAVLLMVTRDSRIAAGGAAILVPFAIGYGSVSLVMAVAGGIVFAWFRRYRPQRSLPVSSWLLTLAAALLGVTSASAALSGAISTRDMLFGTGGGGTSGSGLPSMYVILLDGYPRLDVLAETFSYDNSTFISDLESRGFDHYPDSNVEVAYSERTLLTMFSGHADGLPEPGSGFGHREIMRRVAEASVNGRMRNAGYELVTIRSPIAHVAFLGWETIDTGQLTEFELSLLESAGIAGGLAGWILDQQVDRVVDSLAKVAELAGTDRQQVVLAHLMTPHPPFLFPRPTAPPCWPGCTLYASNIAAMGWSQEEYRDLLVAHISELNARVLATLDQITSTDPSAVVVVMSDHGTRYRNDEEGHLNLMVALTPGRPDLLGSGASPEDFFQRLLDAYSGGE